jgi:HD-GYP domain-containing protein (c-di-GMP phosphodiesterase class II)
MPIPSLNFDYSADTITRPLVSYLPFDGMQRVASGDRDRNAVAAIRRELTQTVAGFVAADALVSAIHRRDAHTRLHSEDTMRYAVSIGREMGLSRRELRALTVAALLHDVGKAALPDSILCSREALTREQFEAVKAHPTAGVNLLNSLRCSSSEPMPEIEAACPAVRHHHECWDGSGYPARLQGEQIPLLARILAVADSYSAMTLDRPYRKALPTKEAIARLRQGAGTQWDPACVRALLRTLGVSAA